MTLSELDSMLSEPTYIIITMPSDMHYVVRSSRESGPEFIREIRMFHPANLLTDARFDFVRYTNNGWTRMVNIFKL